MYTTPWNRSCQTHHHMLLWCTQLPRPPRDMNLIQRTPTKRRRHQTPKPCPCYPTAPSLYPPLPSVALEKDTSHWGRLPYTGRLMSKEAGTPAVTLCALCQAPGPPLPQAVRSYAAGPMQYVHQLFTTTNLLNWQWHTPAYSGTTGCNGALDQHHAQPPTQLG
jgi:hypothetical protein